MIKGTETQFSTVLAGPHDPDNPTFGFRIDHWADQPSAAKLHPSELESHYRRLANADAYRQHGNMITWNCYLTLGYFAYDNCNQFVHHWSKFNEDPIGCHRMIWYNFLFHVDRKLDISLSLQAWATGVSQPYLKHSAPHHLSIDTNVHSWKGLLAGQSMEIESATPPWQQVNSRVRPVRERPKSTKRKLLPSSPRLPNQQTPSSTPRSNQLVQLQQPIHSLTHTLRLLQGPRLCLLLPYQPTLSRCFPQMFQHLYRPLGENTHLTIAHLHLTSPMTLNPPPQRIRLLRQPMTALIE